MALLWRRPGPLSPCAPGPDCTHASKHPCSMQCRGLLWRRPVSSGLGLLWRRPGPFSPAGPGLGPLWRRPGPLSPTGPGPGPLCRRPGPSPQMLLVLLASMHACIHAANNAGLLSRSPCSDFARSWTTARMHHGGPAASTTSSSSSACWLPEGLSLQCSLSPGCSHLVSK